MDSVILEREAMRLKPKDRALLADALLESLDDEAAREVEKAWTLEVASRSKAYRSGLIAAVDGPAVLRELRSRYER